MSHHENKGHSKACCSVPSVKADYTDKGEYTEINGLKTYVTGPSSAEQGILIVYDIFGYSPQGNQGADILSTSDDKKKYRVFIPDFLKGNYAQQAWFPPDTEEKSKKLGDLFSGPANPQSITPEVIKYAQHLAKENPNIKKWAIAGFCWGGKVITLTLQSSDLFSAAASAHPAMVDEKDAPAIKIPYIMLPSKDEDAKAVEAFASKLTVPHEVETFKDQVHGWLGARGDLNDERVNSEYKRGYELILHFFHKHLAPQQQQQSKL